MKTDLPIIRIFVIAAWRDMHAEREALIQKVFPKIQEKCRPQKIKLEIIDLHYKMREDFDIRSIYRSELDHCQIVIALVGEHYGWVPPDSETSFLEDEVEYGILQASEDRKKYCHCYFRNLRSCCRVPTEIWTDYWEDEGEPRYEKMQGLKQRIRNSNVSISEYSAQWDEETMPPWNPSFKGRFIQLDALGDKILQDVGQSIQALIPTISSQTSSGVVETAGAITKPEAISHPSPDVAALQPPVELLAYPTVMQFAREQMSTELVGRDSVLNDLMQFVTHKPEGYMLLVGDPGVGKSALLVHLEQQLQKKNDAPKSDIPSTALDAVANPTSDVISCIPVYIGLTAQSRDVRWVLEYLCQELEKILSKTKPHPTNFETLRDLFPSLLEAASAEKKKILIILDGITELMPCHQAQQFYWLPSYLPAHTHIILSMESNSFETNLKKRLRAEQINLMKLSREEQYTLLNRYIQEHKLSCSENDITAMLIKEHCGYPLYLQLATAAVVTELQTANPLPVSDIIMQLAGTLEEIVANVLQRWEESFGYDITARFFSTLAVSRSALTIADVRKFLQGDAPEYLFGGVWTQLANEIHPYVWQVHDYLQLRHSRIQAAVAKRYLLLDSARMEAHQRLALFLEQQHYHSNIALLDMPYHWMKARNWNRLLRLLTNLDFIESKAAAGMIAQYHQDLWLLLADPTFPPQLQIPLIEPEIEDAEIIEEAEITEVTEEATSPTAVPDSATQNIPVSDAAEVKTQTPDSATQNIPVSDAAEVKTQTPDSATQNIPVSDAAEVKEPDKDTNASNPPITDHPSQEVTTIVDFDIDIPGTNLQEPDTTINIDRGTFGLTKGMPTHQALGYNTIKTLYRALSLDLCFLTEKPQETFQCLWNRCYWYDSPGTAEHYICPDTKGKQFPWQATGSLAYPLMRLWEQKKSAAQTAWLKSKRPLEPHLDSQLQQILRTSLGVSGLAYSKDGKLLAASCWDNTTRIWDIATATCIMILKGHTQWVQSAEFSPSGTELVTGSRDKTIRIWDVESGKCVKTFKGHTNWISAVTFNHDGRKVASSSFDETAKVWDVGTGQCIKTFKGHKAAVTCIAFHKNDIWVATCSQDHTIRLWDIATGNCIKIIKGHTDSVEKIAFNRSSSQLASASFDNTIRIWNPEPNLTMVGSLSNWLKESTNIFQSSTDCLKILTGHTNKITSLHFSPDEHFLATGSWDKTVRIWQVETGECTQILTGHEDSVTAVTFSPNGKNIATGSQDKTVRIWSMDSPYIGMSLRGHSDTVQAVAMATASPLLATGSHDKVISLWNSQTGLWIRDLKGHEDLIYDLAFSPDAKFLATASQDKTVILWDINTGNLHKKLTGHQDWVRCVAFSPNNTHVASGSHDQTIRVWQISNGTCSRIIGHNQSYIRSLAYSPDGKMIAAGCGDKAVRLYRADGQALQTWTGLNDVPTQILFSKDGQQIFVMSNIETRIADIGQENWLQTFTPDQAEQITASIQQPYTINMSGNTMVWGPQLNRPIACLPYELERCCVVERCLSGCGGNYKNSVYLFEIMR